MIYKDNKTRITTIFSVVPVIELIIAGILTLLISPDPKNAWLFGFSKLRWALALLIFLISIGILVIGIRINNKGKTFIDIFFEKKNTFYYRYLWILIIFFIIWGFCSIMFPPYLFGQFANYYERIRPISVAIGLILTQFVFVSINFEKKYFYNTIKVEIRKPSLKTALFISLLFVIIFLFIGLTKIGLVKNIPFWNVAGIPITGLQFLFAIIAVSIFYFLISVTNNTESKKKNLIFSRFLPILIYIVTVLVWGLTPMVKHFFSLQSTPPNYQPFPWSDARWLDIGGLSILKGYGINFQLGSDKPLYMVFLAGLHLIAGNNYSILTWLQIIVLSLIPVILYLFGKQFLGRDFGLFIALITILRQRNAIVLSYKIASVNPKLLISETMTFLGIVLFSYIVFHFIKNPKPWLALLAGGIIGATSLIRLNPLLIFPLIGILSIISIIHLKTKWKLIGLYTLGFLMIFLPVLIIDFSSSSKYDPIEKFQMIFKGRYSLSSPYAIQPSTRLFESELFGTGIENSAIKNSCDYSLVIIQSSNLTTQASIFLTTYKQLLIQTDHDIQVLDRLVNHFLHNIATSTMSLPDGLNYDDLEHLRVRPYWVEGSGWQGDLPIIEVFIIFLNILLIAFGLAYSWNRFRWAGLSPIINFLGYDLSLSFAMTSGSRYIVPIDWILYFYYGVSVIGIIRWIIDLFNKKGEEIPSKGYAIHNEKENKKRLIQTFLLLFIFTSLIPISNNLIPKIIKPPDSIENLNSLVKSIPLTQEKVKNISLGEVYYPYYKNDGTLDFSILKGTKIIRNTINLNRVPLKKIFYGGEEILVGKKNNEIVYIYLVSGSSLELIWTKDPIQN